MATVAQLIIELRAGTERLSQDFSSAIKTVNRFSRQLNQVGTQLTKTFSLPLVALGGGAVKASMDFQESFAGVRKTVNATAEEFKEFERAAKEMSKNVPQSVNEINRVMEVAGQLGVKNKDLMTFTKTMLDLGVTTNMSAEEAALSLARFTNVMGLSGQEVRNLASAIVALGNDSATTERDIVEMAKRLSGAGKVVNITAAEIVGLSAGLSSVGIYSEMGGSAMSRVFTRMSEAVSEGKKKLEGFAAVADMSGQKFQKLFNEKPVEAIMKFVEGLSFAKERGSTMFEVLNALGLSEIRLKDTTLRAAAAYGVMKGSVDLSIESAKSDVAITEEANKKYSTSLSTLKKYYHQIYLVGIEIGDRLVPSVLRAVEAVADLAESFSKLPRWVQDTAVGMALFLAALGPVLFGISQLLLALTGLAAMFGAGGTIAKGGAAVASVFKAVSQAVGTLKTAVELAVLTLSEGLYNALAKVASIALAPTLGALATGFGVVLVGAIKAAHGEVELFLKGFVELVTDIPKLLLRLKNPLSDWWASWFKALQPNFQKGLRVIEDFFARVFNSITARLEDFGRRWDVFWQRLRTGIYAIGDFLDNDAWKKWAVEAERAARIASGELVEVNKNLKITSTLLGATIPEWKNIGTAISKALTTTPETAEKEGLFQKLRNEVIKAKGDVVAFDEQVQKLLEGSKKEKSSLEGLFDKVDEAAEKAKEKTENAFQSIQDELRNTKSEIEKTKIGEAIENGLEANLDASYFEKYYEQLHQNTYQAVLDGLEDSVADAGPAGKALAEQIASLRADEEERAERERVGKAILENRKEIYQESVDWWQSLMEDAITGTRFDFEEQFKKAVAAIAARWIVLMISGNDTILGSLGTAFSQWFSGSGLGNIFGPIFGGGGNVGSLIQGANTVSGVVGAGSAISSVGLMTALENVFSGAPASAVGSAMTASGEAGYMLADGTVVPAGGFGSGLSSILGPAAAIYGGYQLISNFGNMSLGGGALSGVTMGAGIGSMITPGIGTAIGAVGGAIVGAISSMFGDDTDVYQEIRDKIMKHLKENWNLPEDKTLQVGTGGEFKLSDAWQNGENVWEGTHTKGAEEALGMTSSLAAILTGGAGGYAQEGLANAMANMVAGFGDATAEVASFNEVYANTLSLMDQFGLTAEEGKSQLMSLFLDGKVSMEEFGAGIQNMNLLAQENLLGTGSVSDALDIVAKNLGPEGNPRNALKGLELAFKEAAEVGEDALGTLKTFIAERFGEEAANTFEEKIKQAGIQSFEDLNNLSADQLFLLFEAFSTWATDTIETQDEVNTKFEEGAESVYKMRREIEDLPESKTVTIDIEKNVTVNGDSGDGDDSNLERFGNVYGVSRKYAKGGVVYGRTPFRFAGGAGIMGEMGPEAILPLKRIGPKLGVYAEGLESNNVFNFNIDARGAVPGMERKILIAAKAQAKVMANQAIREMRR